MDFAHELSEVRSTVESIWDRLKHGVPSDCRQDSGQLVLAALSLLLAAVTLVVTLCDKGVALGLKTKKKKDPIDEAERGAADGQGEIIPAIQSADVSTQTEPDLFPKDPPRRWPRYPPSYGYGDMYPHTQAHVVDPHEVLDPATGARQRVGVWRKKSDGESTPEDSETAADGIKDRYGLF